MKLTPVIAALRARCPYFENRVAGAAQFKNLPEVGKLGLPAAYVVPGDDSPGENKSQTDYWQELKEGFSVVVILSNGRDERGQFASYDVVDDVRQMLFKALLGWNPEACGNPITYDGGTLLDLNRHELIYQFDFSVISELTEDDTRQQDELNSLDELRTLAIDVDYLDPGKRQCHATGKWPGVEWLDIGAHRCRC
ncbi:phage tail terminator protein [Escherichia coli]|uniref:phage tail terminator protein n=1 Tax=Escherichia coli TaxID=562 RepID=UPI003561CF35